MAVSSAVLVDSKTMEDIQTSQYTVPTGVTAIIDRLTVTNVSGSDAAVSVNLVPAGASATSSNLIVKYKMISAWRSYTFPEVTGHALSAGESISTIATVASALNIRVSGRVVT